MVRLRPTLLCIAPCFVNVTISHAQGVDGHPASCTADLSPTQISAEIDQLVHDLQWRAVEIPAQRLDRWLNNCGFDDGMKKLKAAGFKMSEDEKLSTFELNRGVQRVAVGDKLLRIMNHPIVGPMGSFQAMIVLREVRGKLETYGRFYADGP
jgi:hypothetical protein